MRYLRPILALAFLAACATAGAMSWGQTVRLRNESSRDIVVVLYCGTERNRIGRVGSGRTVTERLRSDCRRTMHLSLREFGTDHPYLTDAIIMASDTIFVTLRYPLVYTHWAPYP